MLNLFDDAPSLFSQTALLEPQTAEMETDGPDLVLAAELPTSADTTDLAGAEPRAVHGTADRFRGESARSAPALKRDSTAEAAGVPRLQASMEAALTALQHARETMVPAIREALSEKRHLKEAEPLLNLISGFDCEYDQRLALWVSAVESLVEHAERAFAPASGVPLTIDRHAVWLKAGYNPADTYRNSRKTGEHAYVFPTLAAVWQVIEDTHGSDTAQAALEEEAVQAFIRTFIRRWGKLAEPEWNRGRLLLSLHVWTEKRISGRGYELGYSSRQGLAKDFTVLANVFRVVGATALARALEHHATWGAWSQREVVSRERFVLAQDSFFTTYLKKIDIEIGATVAADLMSRVSESLAADPPRE